MKYIWQQYSKASCIVNRADLLLDFGVERLSFDAIKVAWMLQKCCNQKKTQWKYWTQWTFRPLKNAKIPTKTHEMDVLDALENRTLESHSRGPGFESLCAHKNEPIGSFLFFETQGFSSCQDYKKQGSLLENMG